MHQQPASNGHQGGDVASSVPPAQRSIFRAEALQRYRENQDRVELPRLVTPRVFTILWVLVLLLLVVGSTIAFWPLLGQLW